MLDAVRTAYANREPGFWQDIAGGMALVVILFGALHLPILL